MKKLAPLMRCRLFTLASVLSLLMCAASVALWVRSYEPTQYIGDGFDWHGLQAGSIRGSLLIDTQNAKTSRTVVTRKPDGTEVVSHYMVAYAPTHRLSVPYLAIVSATMTLPIAWLASFARTTRCRRRRRQGKCLRCGYDLTGNISGTCPECGTAVPTGLELRG